MMSMIREMMGPILSWDMLRYVCCCRLAEMTGSIVLAGGAGRTKGGFCCSGESLLSERGVAMWDALKVFSNHRIFFFSVFLI